MYKINHSTHTQKYSINSGSRHSMYVKDTPTRFNYQAIVIQYTYIYTIYLLPDPTDFLRKTKQRLSLEFN